MILYFLFKYSFICIFSLSRSAVKGSRPQNSLTTGSSHSDESEDELIVDENQKNKKTKGKLVNNLIIIFSIN